MVERAEIRPYQHPRHHAIPFGLGEGHALQLRKRHFHRIDFFKRRHDRLSSRFSQLSYAGLTRVSIKLQKSLAKRMDCRERRQGYVVCVRPTTMPGNDV